MYRGDYTGGGRDSYRSIQPAAASIQPAHQSRGRTDARQPQTSVEGSLYQQANQAYLNQLPRATVPPLLNQPIYYPPNATQIPMQQYAQIPRATLLPPPQLMSSTDPSLSLPRRRARGFDQLPYEQVGGDMEISRSRSGSPKRGHRSRSPVRKFEEVRDGILWSDDNYLNFLVYWVDRFEPEKPIHREAKLRKLTDNITKANRAEKEKIVLPPEYSKSDRDRLLHCDLTIQGLPSSIFFGSGYGTRGTSAKNAAAKDLIDKCHRIGVISSKLHAAIGDRYQLDRKKYSGEITQSVEAIHLLRKKIANENFPKEVMTQRQLDPEIIERFKMVLRRVMMEVYYSDARPAKNEKAQSSTKKPQPTISTEKLLAMKEKELKMRLEAEMEAKRTKMEEEIRAKIVEEERAKIREEFEREKRIEMMLVQQQQYEKEKEMKEREKHLLEQQQKDILAQMQMQKEVEDELNRMVVQLELKLLEFKNKGMTSVLELIFSSSAFKTIASLAESTNKMSVDEKKQLIVDLKALLECAALSVNTLMGAQNSSFSSYPTQMQQSSSYGIGSTSSYGNYSYSNEVATIEAHNRAEFPLKSAKDIRIPPSSSSSRQQGNKSSSSRPSSSKPSSSSTSKPQSQQRSSTNQEPVKRVQVGDLVIRSFNSIEQRRLTTGSKIIAQDMKTGKWQMGTIKSISNNRATVAVGNNTWKKDLDDLYTEDES